MATSTNMLGPRRGGYTLLELHVALVVMAVGLMGIGALMVRQGRQVGRMEKWCSTSRTYYLVAQSDPWMRAVEAPAALTGTAGQSPWTPDVDRGNVYEATVESLSQPYGLLQASADVKLVRVGTNGTGGGNDDGGIKPKE